MSGAPIWRGTMKLAKPPNAMGPAKRYIIRLPCMVNSALNCEKLSSDECGEDSCSRMIIAMIPEM
jgi:hypothetical protein